MTDEVNIDMADQDPCPPDDSWYRILVKQFPNGVIILFDRNLRYVAVGPDILPFSKRKAVDMEGKTIYELFPEETAAELEPHYRATLEGESHSFDIAYDGQIHHLETRPVDIEDKPRHGLAITQNVTEERRRERELKRQNERLEMFAGIISHDLRNPLNVAEGYLDLEQETNTSENLVRVEQALTRMRRIIEDLLTAAQQGRTVKETESVELDAVVRDAWEMVESDEVALVVDTDQTIVADISRIQTLLENLFRNAVEHGGDEVTVGPLPEGFYIEDDGPGIPVDARTQVFEPGYSTREDGTGFGLLIVKDIAEAHGWEVELSESETGGARFEFTEIRTTT
jgi:PAS domain S-box-containing protein